MQKKLSENFITELFKLCLRNKTVVEICKQHLQYNFLPEESHKMFWKEFLRHYNANNSIPGIGIVSQGLLNARNAVNSEKIEIALEFIEEVKNADLNDAPEMLGQLEFFIKNSMFQELYEKLAELYNSNKQEEAFKLLSDRSIEINDFVIREQTFESIFSNFGGRNQERIFNAANKIKANIKIPFAVDALTKCSNGGCNIGDIYMYIARSGIGKSKGLKADGINAARLGFRVLHIQLEGSKQECLDAYDAGWSAIDLSDLEVGQIDKSLLDKLTKISGDVVRQGGDIHVVAYEKFNTATTLDLRQSIIDVEKVHGKVNLVIVDYFEKMSPVGMRINRSTIEGEKAFRQALGDQFKNIAVELQVVIGTATQASEVPEDKWNNNKFVLTRSNIKGDKNQVDPFSYVFTFNQTRDEKKARMMRIHEDKIRKYDSGKTHIIYQRYDKERFYDRKRTLEYLESNAA